MLAFGKRFRLPVGEALAFGDAFAENDGVDSLEAIVAYVIIFDKLLKVNFGLRIDLSDFVEIAEVVVERYAYFAVEGDSRKSTISSVRPIWLILNRKHLVGA